MTSTSDSDSATGPEVKVVDTDEVVRETDDFFELEAVDFFLPVAAVVAAAVVVAEDTDVDNDDAV